MGSPPFDNLWIHLEQNAGGFDSPQSTVPIASHEQIKQFIVGTNVVSKKLQIITNIIGYNNTYIFSIFWRMLCYHHNGITLLATSNANEPFHKTHNDIKNKLN